MKWKMQVYESVITLLLRDHSEAETDAIKSLNN